MPEVPQPPLNAQRPGASPAGQPPYPSRTIAGRYRLDRVLGKGSMGTVWAAYDETLHRRVAIKEINFPSGLPDSERQMLIERTLREARAIAQLSHPNVITLYDILTLDSGPVIVMEVLAARSLGEVLKEVGPLTDGQAATVGLTVASGLSAAHAAGITHRDVKPGNVLIGGDGRIKLTDFGIARSAAENPMTATGLLLGSPAYIAPEVASGSTAGPPADAWGLGALLFASLEGRPPFDKGSPVATLMSVVTDPVPSLNRAGRLTPVIEGLLNKDPRQRMGLAEARSRLSGIASDPVEGRLVFPPTGSVQRPPGPGGPGRPPAASGQYRPPTLTGGSSPPPPGWQPARGSGGFGNPAGGSGALPPPPWATSGVAHLAPLPAASNTSGGSATSTPRPGSGQQGVPQFGQARPMASQARPSASPPNPIPTQVVPTQSAPAKSVNRVAVAVAIIILAAALGFWGVRLIVDAVSNSSAPSAVVAHLSTALNVSVL